MPDPIGLGFDTSAAHCAAALLCGDRVLASRHEEMAKGQAERLFPLLEGLLAEAGLGWAELDVIGVGIGPGNFTGIRVAVAAARGLALSLGIPAVGVTITEAAAFDLPRPCRVAVPSRRDQVIWQDFGADEDEQAGSRPQQAAAGALPPGPAPAAPAVPLAEAIARLALARRQDPGPRPAPLYLRPADAAPPREAAPVILP
ncbi:tRNA (adenosine(37)-N6)-threonylcarbamoyltransferase complex dimerization subunit type 1 TsaB [Paracoccus siganidrum]|uniref:tRNA (Adenosine(37)-N6)-threonylcarbamoyltransferase complex dimerization subunit type 1 TsaB n=1 Tax=Paracoccus siganidrum TaxID=1276757 RepID=A0A419A697_9RHOB|nr:tRNA (adenosine(37)-N6)-threonylcarbamoyltransferase complex dimerization subunit type 1 TsaB [Paracoccus siganidrum]RJL13960.1 tRNA (adenosine(37)-N6)-threonylcarbamoyltransferase complex dimerization subunit type 1 TsaB [Paracoccus siganidrum]RMC41013.1 tRNA (adenosine(37)-N6)-threonylcarbamoyltransferase complex dimerization subunit type 1 TsaB [Paracoccus siganidrum]